jgi:hypothetical protein
MIPDTGLMSSTDRTNPETIRYLYSFAFPDGMEKRFEINLNASTLELVPDTELPKPDWGKLHYVQCEHCPLGPDVEYCPIAVNLAHLVDAFKDSVSFESALVTVESRERTYVKQTTLQKGLSSIIGIYMVTSNCPVMDQLRPVVRFHLPFATSEETTYRIVSMYLTTQYFIMRKGGKPDWGLSNLAEIYQAVTFVNKGMARRLVQASTKDANVNAVIILSTFSETLGSFFEDSLNELERLFSQYTSASLRERP